MISFYLRGHLEESCKFLKALKVVTLAESLGGFESLAELPFSMTHASVEEKERIALGVTDNLIRYQNQSKRVYISGFPNSLTFLVRLSVGLEDADDLIEDIKQALDAAVA
jgi:cystathionine gamma-lyase